ncbi:MAG: hypothetical protein WB439_00005, partial [Acidobacteriaceae bacterium]
MGLLSQGGICRGCGWLGAVALVGLCCGVRPVQASPLARVGHESARLESSGQGQVSDWDAAVAERRRFEAEPARLRTRADFEHVMNGFRAIYRGSPGDVHAAAAVAQVAELFEQMGRELGDVKSTQAAVGQYEYVAKAYPGDRLAPVALVKALRLLGPGDAVEAAKVRKELVEDYPRDARRDGIVVDEAGGGSSTSQKLDVGRSASSAGATAGLSTAALRASGRDDKFVGGEAADSSRDESAGAARRSGVGLDADATVAAPVVRVDAEQGRVIPEVVEKVSGPLAVVTGIRHWS